MSAWLKGGGDKKKFLSCSMKLKDRDEDTPDGPKKPNDDDEIPF